MAAHTTLLDFHVDSAVINNNAETAKLQLLIEKLLNKLEFQKKASLDTQPGFLMFFEGEKQSHGVVRCFADGFVTITLEENVNNQTPRVAPMVAKVLQRELEELLKLKVKRYASVKRGGLIDQYITTSDGRIVEYDFDKVVYEADSPFQNIKILHSPSFGNLLVLDDLQNLAESDLIYTHSLMCYGEENYKDKEILILGGGDGALLHELLKEDPKFVTMIEIDQMVMDACKIHLRSACGDTLDKMKGENYEIVVADCVKMMEKYISDGKKFDYVFGDLTDIPITPTPQGEFWDFMRHILELSMKVLKPSGKYMTHGTGVNAIQSQSMYEDQLKKLSVPVDFRKYSAHVPSFMEKWVFYQVWLQPSIVNGNGIADRVHVNGK